MSTIWIYNDEEYNSQAEVEAAVTAFKNRLDNNPTDWCLVKLLSGDAENGWVVPTETLTDEEINNMSSSNYYNVSAIYDGYTYTAVDGAVALEKVQYLRTLYATWKRANTIEKAYPPTNEDMSGYVT